MKEKVRKALEESIIHWQENAAGEGDMRFGPSGCRLCQISAGDCSGCPVRDKIGEAGCRNTPWEEIFKHYIVNHFLKSHKSKVPHLEADCPTCRALAEKEAAFLVSLRPAEKVTDGTSA